MIDCCILENYCNFIVESYNLKPLKSNGLINGKMGYTIFLYEASRYFRNKEYEKMAERVLEEVIMNPPQIQLDISTGLSGIGIGMLYLIQNKYCNVSSIFFKGMDNIIYKELIDKENTNETLLFDVLSYYAQKNDSLLKGKRNVLESEVLIRLVNQVCSILPKYTVNLRKDTCFDLYDRAYYTIDTLLKLYQRGLCNEKILRTFMELVEIATSLIPKMHFNRLNLAITLFRINGLLKNESVSKYINMLLGNIDTNQLIAELDENRFLYFRKGLAGQIAFLKDIQKEDIIRNCLGNTIDECLRYAHQALNEKVRHFEKYVAAINADTSLCGCSGFALLCMKYPLHIN